MNPVADSLSRSTSASINQPSQLEDIHNNLGHPGVTRMFHFIRMKNLPFSTDDIRKVCSSCKTCAENKPRFYRTPQTALIKATEPMEQINIDFKGSIPSSSENKYILTIIDEYSRFPFAVPCPTMNPTTVIQGLNQMFTLTGLSSYIHSDRGPSLISHSLTFETWE
ncbi:KRAB-A domain-containing protein 2-like [Clavelina lepadiformis]|uniref:KRAB-A domain-containing protein 2-like n=1 Tax=Clavelina lepadiformis TaxID=159417 RepID=UPI004042ADC3